MDFSYQGYPEVGHCSKRLEHLREPIEYFWKGNRGDTPLLGTAGLLCEDSVVLALHGDPAVAQARLDTLQLGTIPVPNSLLHGPPPLYIYRPPINVKSRSLTPR